MLNFPTYIFTILSFYYIPPPIPFFVHFFPTSFYTHIAFVVFTMGGVGGVGVCAFVCSGSELVEYKLQATQRNAQLQWREMLKNDETI